MDFPDDRKRVIASGMLLVRTGELDLDRPAYVIEARMATTIGKVFPAFCPEIQERNITVDACLKRKKQVECHPLETFPRQVEEEWYEYGKAFKQQEPSLKDVPPHKYTVEMVRACVVEPAGAQRR